MKEVFMPTMDELYEMQDTGADMQLYLYAKAIEALCIEYNNYPKKGSILKNEFKYIKEDEIIAHAICKMYPNEIIHSKIAQYDRNLAVSLITEQKSQKIYNLDYLSNFSQCVTGNLDTLVINILAQELKNNPEYRFEYKKSKLLDDVFMGKMEVNKGYICNLYLSEIEPYYALLAGDKKNIPDRVINYINRYGFEYTNENTEKKDILTNQTTEVKRLFRCINRK